MHVSSRGRFITLEGIEGTGKSTLAPALGAWLAGRGIPALLTREPGGTPLAERLRELVLTPQTEELPAAAETLLMFAARSVHIAHRIEPALVAGTWVVCDRFTDASLAYQGGGRGVDAAWLASLAQQVQGALEPDLTLLLDAPVALGLARARARKGAAAADRFVTQGEAFFERVRQRYLELAAAAPRRFLVVDASASMEEVCSRACAALTELVARPHRTADLR
jgi:dTMP kinase